VRGTGIDTPRLQNFFLHLSPGKTSKILHRPGIEPGPPAWQASILPLNQRCQMRILLKEPWAAVAEWLTRLTRNQFPSGSVGSNPTSCASVLSYQFLDSLVVRISACHVEGPGSIPGRGGTFFGWQACMQMSTVWLSIMGYLHQQARVAQSVER
jgi:hypothetical protein